MRNTALATVALVLAALACACGSTQVMTNVPGARVYVNGVESPTGEFRKRGAPGTTTVEIVAPDGRRIVKQVKRSFTATSFFAGMFTYGIGFFAAWEYPDAVLANFEHGGGSTPANSWDHAPGGDVWQNPNGFGSQRTAPPQHQQPTYPLQPVDNRVVRAHAPPSEDVRQRACTAWLAQWKKADATDRAALEAGKPKHCDASPSNDTSSLSNDTSSPSNDTWTTHP